MVLLLPCRFFRIFAGRQVDDAFKLVFGQESTKDVMIEFLNQVITDKRMAQE